ncbi:hypothetical protein SLA2020_001060 [Shorea laevis]
MNSNFPPKGGGSPILSLLLSLFVRPKTPDLLYLSFSSVESMSTVWLSVGVPFISCSFLLSHDFIQRKISPFGVS